MIDSVSINKRISILTRRFAPRSSQCRAQAKTFSVSATALTNTVKEQITSLNEAVTIHLISSLETHTAAAATSTTTLNSTLKLNSSIKENVSSFTTSATSVLTDDVMAVCANIQSSTEEKVNAIVKTFEDGERLLETEIDQGVKEAETKVEVRNCEERSDELGIRQLRSKMRLHEERSDE